MDRLVPTHGHADDDAENGRDDKADQKVGQAEPHMLPDRAVGEKLVALEDDFAKRRKVEGVDNLKASRKLPAKKKSNDADDAEPVGKKLARALP